MQQSAFAALADRAVRDALRILLATLPEQARLTPTWDQGPEMALHHEVAPPLREGVSFARPARPLAARRQRGHERPAAPVFPKRTSLAAYAASDLRAVEERLNNRPRET